MEYDYDTDWEFACPQCHMSYNLMSDEYGYWYCVGCEWKEENN